VRTKDVLYVGSECRIGVDVFPQRACADAEFHGQAEYVYKLVTGMADEVGPENTIAGAIDDDLRPSDPLGVGPRRKPVVHVVDMDFGRQALRLGGGLGQADSGKGGNRIDRGRDARVVRAVLRPINDIAAGEITLISRNRRKLG